MNRGIPDMVDFTWKQIFLRGNIERILRHPRADEENINLSNVKYKETVLLGLGFFPFLLLWILILFDMFIGC